MPLSKIKIGVEVIIEKDGKVLFGKRLSAAGAGSWGLPGGKLEVGESLKGCAKRELIEETGIIVEELELINIANDPRDDGHWIHITFSAKKYSGEPKVLEPTKCEKWEWLSLDKLPENMFYGHRQILKGMIGKMLLVDE